MKNLTNDAVKDTALALLAKNQTTTTLEVKNELRAQGYFATQNQVSAIMFNNYDEFGLEFVPAGNHREYRVVVMTGVIPTVMSPQVSQTMQDAIDLCEANGLLYRSNSRQKINGTLYFTDPRNPNDAYSITKKGYARRHMLKGGYCGGDAMYQLNKKIKTTRTNNWGTFESYERVLLPGRYVDLAEIAVRIAKRHRNS